MNDPPVPELGGYDPDRYDGWTLDDDHRRRCAARLSNS